VENDFFPSDHRSLNSENLIENIFDQDDCVLIDHSGLLNIFHTLTRANYNRVSFRDIRNISTMGFFS
jgi:hypothetical protein